MYEYDQPREQQRGLIGQSPINPHDLYEYDFGSNADRQAELAYGSGGPETQPVPDMLTDASVAEVDPFTARMDEELNPALERLENAANANERRAAAMEVANWTRTNMIDQAELQAYLGRTDITWEEKTATLGQLAVEVARSEFLAGWSHEGGVDTGTWEDQGSNRGVFPSHYQDTVLTYGRETGAEWCTSFAGYTQDRLGFQYNQDTSASNSHSIFWSGYRLNHWAETGQSNSGTQLTPGERTVDTGTEGSRYVDGDTWSELRSDLRGASTPEARELATTDFMTAQGTPQAGDIMVLGNNNTYRNRGKSHTVMVERYDAENQVIYTIEGNADSTVTSRRIDLRDPADAAQIVSSVRIGAGMFVDEETRAGVNAGTPQNQDPERGPVTAEQLLNRARGVNGRLVATAHEEGYIESDDENASAYVWTHGSDEATDQTIGTQ